MDTDAATVNSWFCAIDSWKRSKLTQEIYCKNNFLDYHDFTKYRALYLKERRNLKRETCVSRIPKLTDNTGVH